MQMRESGHRLETISSGCNGQATPNALGTQTDHPIPDSDMPDEVFASVAPNLVGVVAIRPPSSGHEGRGVAIHIIKHANAVGAIGPPSKCPRQHGIPAQELCAQYRLRYTTVYLRTWYGVRYNVLHVAPHSDTMSTAYPRNPYRQI